MIKHGCYLIGLKYERNEKQRVDMKYGLRATNYKR